DKRYRYPLNCRPGGSGEVSCDVGCRNTQSPSEIVSAMGARGRTSGAGTTYRGGDSARVGSSRCLGEDIVSAACEFATSMAVVATLCVLVTMDALARYATLPSALTTCSSPTRKSR